MAKTQTLETIRKNVTKLLDKREKEVTAIQTKIAELTVAAESAQSDMDRASDNTDTAAYSAAKRIKLDAEDGVEMYQAKLEHLQATPIVTAETFTEMCSDVLTDLSSKEESAKCMLASLTSEMLKIGEKYSDQITEAAAVLAMLHDQVFPGWKDSHLPNRREIPRKYYETVQWSQGPSENYTFQQYAHITSNMNRSQRMAAALAASSGRSGKHFDADDGSQTADQGEDEPELTADAAE